MPELPEVETIRLGLQKTIVGKKIIKFKSKDPKVVQFKPEDVENSTIKSIDRRAKVLIFGLDNNKSILIHLKMTGQLIWEACAGGTEFCLKKGRIAGGHPSPDWVAKLPNAYTRAIFHFDDDSALFFNDLRRFGYLKLYGSSDVQNEKELKKLGPEPFSNEFTVEYLIKKASKIPNRKIKQFITDQEIIAGVGNIYVDEALFYAGILPTRAVKDIQLSGWKKIRESIIKALELGLKYGGSSEDTYVDAFGNQGTMNEHTMVYRKTGQSCKRNGCNGVVKRITLGGRGTHFCSNCQK
ncbi:MAG: bifunctional DNA-formamidopyrimidine glycosylase/DNA-(apurinic or apyrimidinic site) lyase [Patescibacteria group bacterium]|nr:bifunctional DNA-formamidopyrimidine glycosylase/DNA-(apurinic or apyrimidinic site) lyase [Patescibacteria group bacterium]